jgi:membrane protease YdiL (CAAX protease family)
VILLQALSFSVAHWDGIPNGGGGLLATFLFGLLLGALRVRSRRSIRDLVVIHALADVGIGLRVISMVEGVVVMTGG